MVAQRTVSTLEGPRQLQATTRTGANGVYVDIVIRHDAVVLGTISARCFRICPSHSQFRDMTDEEIANVALADFAEGRCAFDIHGAISACRTLQRGSSDTPGHVIYDWHRGESQLLRDAMAANAVT